MSRQTSTPDQERALRDALVDFLAVRGHDVAPVGPNAWIARRAGEPPRGLVFVPESAAEPMTAAAEALGALRAAGVPADSVAPVVKASRAGLNRAEIARLGGSPLTPPQYFDWYYRARQKDDADGEAGVSRLLRAKVDQFRVRPRAPQPYRRLASLAPDAPPLETGRDLYEILAPRFASARAEPRLIVLCGPAGVGKSVLTAELLDTAHAAFNAAKQRDALASRPILFEPAELGSTAADAADIQSFDALIEALYGAEIARAVPPKAFAWLNEQGLNSWILDGLDEFFRRQTDFFATLGETLDAPGGRAQILMSTRDSLFASSDALRDFLHHRLAVAPETTEIYELERWDAAAKRAYVEAVLIAEQGAAGRPQIDAIATRIEARPDLVELSDLPFYCSRLVAAIRKGEERALESEFALLQFTIDAIVDREVREKQVIQLAAFVPEFDREDIAAAVSAEGGDAAALSAAVDARGRAELEDMLGLAAYLTLFAGETPQESMEAEDWVGGVLPTLIAPELNEAAAARLELALAHFPLFGRGAREGEVRFVHRLAAEYLASTHAMSVIRSNPDAPRIWEMALGRRRDWMETVFFRRIAAELRADPALRRKAEAAVGGGALNKNATQRIMALLDA